ncbi:hypothetical protein DPMN_074216 [Dreissena polymorpha]|uniref:Uncharacterized protein n=1 Tax=Dreissena polymorpha TaxID=45954 RepID=A0A9D3YHZ9_DREPO|nr:hypothetical protein DPMN_074216 [Dreissena polymorpha]
MTNVYTPDRQLDPYILVRRYVAPELVCLDRCFDVLTFLSLKDAKSIRHKNYTCARRYNTEDGNCRPFV